MPAASRRARGGARTAATRRTWTIGVISDTHGLVRAEALRALAVVDAIVHAGDVGTPEVLAVLGTIAPVIAVRGNNDVGAWARRLPVSATLTLGGARLYVLHDRHALDLDPRAAGFAAVIAGHSHRPAIERQDGVLWVNPGSAGPRRFRLPVAVARLRITAGRVRGRVVLLTPER